MEKHGGFLKWWYPTTMGFPTKNDHFGVIWGYHHFRKHPHGVQPFLKMDPCKLASLNLRFRHTFWSLTLQKVWFWCRVWERNIIFPIIFWCKHCLDFEFDLKSDLEGGIEIQGRQLVLDPQGELKQLYYHKALRGATVWGFKPFGETTKRLAFWRKATFGAPEGVQDEGFKLFINAAWRKWKWMEHDGTSKDSDSSESLFSL